jgi:HEAT repeat protein
MKLSSLSFALIVSLFVVGCRRAPTVAFLTSDDRETRERALENLAALPDHKKQPLIDPLAEALKNGDSRISQRAGLALVKIGAAAVPALTQALHSDDIFLKLNTLDTLAQMGTTAEPALPAIIEATRHAHPLVRSGAATALGAWETPSPDAEIAVQALLKDKDSGVQDAAKQTSKKWTAAKVRPAA